MTSTLVLGNIFNTFQEMNSKDNTHDPKHEQVLNMIKIDYTKILNLDYREILKNIHYQRINK